MFPHALIATDLSAGSGPLLECTAQLQGLGTQRVTLVHVAETRYSVGLDDALAADHLPDLEMQAETLRGQGYEVEIRLAKGVAWYEVVEAARQAGADLVVTASHGRGAVLSSLLGGTAARIVEYSPCPVLVLRMSLMEQEGGRYCPLRFSKALDHVLFPTDFSEASRKALEALQGLAGRIGQISLVHVNQRVAWEHLSPEIAASYTEDDARRLADMTEVLRGAGCGRVESEIAQGDPRKVLLEHAAREDVSLVLMATRGWGQLPGMLLGSTAYSLVRRARAPVLLVHG
ncbi:MAG: universal stress protein [Deferrisomatales bacterium]